MGGFVGKVTDAIGLTDIEGQQEAARDAAGTQAASGRESIAFQRESRDLARADLSPFVSFATGMSPASGNMLLNPPQASSGGGQWSRMAGTLRDRAAVPVTGAGQQAAPAGPGYTSSSPMGQYLSLLDPSAQASWLENNPLFQAAMERSNTGFRNTLGFSGKRGDLANAITQNYMASGTDYINNQRNALMQPIQIGQASAAGQAANAINTGQSIGNTITGIGNAQAAGIIGAGNAYSQGMNSLLGAGALLGGAALGNPALFSSDERLKRDIVKIDEDDFGGIYQFRYVDHDSTYIGRMAQELQKTRPDAVFEGEDGYLRVTSEFAPRFVHGY